MGNNTVLAFVGMPGSGKTEASAYLQNYNIPFVRFGALTEEYLKEKNLLLTPENERIAREEIRKFFGMGAYAKKAIPSIEELLKKNSVIAIDGLYSWEEYVLLKEKFSNIVVIYIFAEPKKRYKRLSERKIRPVPLGESYARDVSEIENLNKGGPIAIADFLIDNTTDNKEKLYSNIDSILAHLGIKK